MNTLQCLEKLGNREEKLEFISIEESFKQSWQEIKSGKIYPIEQLWDNKNKFTPIILETET